MTFFTYCIGGCTGIHRVSDLHTTEDGHMCDACWLAQGFE